MLERNAKRNMPLIYTLVGIPFLLYVFIVIVPLCVSVFYSFLKWDGVGAQSFAGLKNYATMMADRNFWLSTTNTLVIALYCVLGQVGIALLIAFLMTNRRLKLKEFHRTVIFFPVVLAPVVIGFVWKFVYNSNFGLLNTFLRALGLESWIRLWMDDINIILTTVSIPVMWQYIGLYLVILMSAISSVPTEVYECAEIDGASWMQRSLKITLPMIWDTLKIAIILCASGTMKIYDHIYIMTNGGPGRSSSVLALYCFKTTFDNSNFGYGSAISVALLVFSLLISVVIQLLMGSMGEEKRMKKIKSAASWFFLNVPIMLLSFTCIFPVIWLGYSSLKTGQEFNLNSFSLPSTLNFENYQTAFSTAKFDVYLFNSMFNSFISLAFVLMFSFVVGYLLSRYRFRGRALIYGVFLAGILVPIYALIVPMFIMFKGVGLLNQRLTLLFPYIAFELPMSIFLVDSYVKSISKEMEDAASIDGAGLLRTMFSIIMPICKPVLSTVVILAFMHTWNEFPFAQMLVMKAGFKTVPVGLTSFSSQYSVDYTLLMAALMMATLPVVLIYLLFYKKIMQGMMAGAVKG